MSIDYDKVALKIYNRLKKSDLSQPDFFELAIKAELGDIKISKVDKQQLIETVFSKVYIVFFTNCIFVRGELGRLLKEAEYDVDSFNDIMNQEYKFSKPILDSIVYNVLPFGFPKSSAQLIIFIVLHAFKKRGRIIDQLNRYFEMDNCSKNDIDNFDSLLDEYKDEFINIKDFEKITVGLSKEEKTYLQPISTINVINDWISIKYNMLSKANRRITTDVKAMIVDFEKQLLKEKTLEEVIDQSCEKYNWKGSRKTIRNKTGLIEKLDQSISDITELDDRISKFESYKNNSPKEVDLCNGLKYEREKLKIQINIGLDEILDKLTFAILLLSGKPRAKAELLFHKLSYYI